MKAERDAAKAAAKAEKERADALETATKSETEKAIAAARKEGNLEATTKLTAAIRKAEVKAALTAAGLSTEFLGVAVKADQFEAIEVGENGEVSGLDSALEAFKAAFPAMFKAPGAAGQNGSADGGSRGGSKVTKEQVIAWSKNPAEYERHRDEIQAWQAAQ